MKDFSACYIVFISFSSMIVTDGAFSMAFVTSCFDIDGNFIKEFLLLFLIALNHSITDLMYCYWFTWDFFSDFNGNNFKIVFAIISISDLAGLISLH